MSTRGAPARLPLPGGERDGVRGLGRGRPRALRRNATDAEKKLWSKLRNRQLDGLKFKRQVPLGRFVVDFACLEHHLVVEVDGGQHASAMARDAARTRELEAGGYLVVRFWNNDVMTNMEGVLTAILSAVRPETSAAPHPDPLPTGERGSESSRRDGA